MSMLAAGFGGKQLSAMFCCILFDTCSRLAANLNHVYAGSRIWWKTAVSDVCCILFDTRSRLAANSNHVYAGSRIWWATAVSNVLLYSV
jgi:hypothetical protein